MDTWTALQDHVRGRHPQVVLRRAERAGIDWVTLQVPLCPLAETQRYQLLAYNFELVIGQIVNQNGQVILQQSLPLSDLALATVDEVATDLIENVPVVMAAIRSAERTSLDGTYEE